MEGRTLPQLDQHQRLSSPGSEETKRWVKSNVCLLPDIISVGSAKLS